jgi:hypothetical protein
VVEELGKMQSTSLRYAVDSNVILLTATFEVTLAGGDTREVDTWNVPGIANLSKLR